MSKLAKLVDRAMWAARKPPSRTRAALRVWSPAEVEKLHQMVGKFSVTEIARQLGRNRNSVCAKLMHLGYEIKADVQLAAGVNLCELARRIGAPYEVVYRDFRDGLLPNAVRENAKDFLVSWKVAKRYERRLARIRGRRERKLARIRRVCPETITKKEFMALVGLRETHATRYLQGKIVRAWKVPCMWQLADRQRWEWLIDKRDAERVARLRASGKLRLRKRAYRRIAEVANAQIYKLIHERRAGTRKANGPRTGVMPGSFSIAQVAQMQGLSSAQVYQHVHAGILKAARVPVGGMTFMCVAPADYNAYRRWCARNLPADKALRPYWTATAAVHARGLLTIAEAAAEFGINRGTLAAYAQDGAVPCVVVGRMRGLKRADVARFAARYKRRQKQ